MDIDPAPGSLLTPADEAALLRRIDAGTLAAAILAGEVASPVAATVHELHLLVRDGRQARADLVAANTGLVWFIVRPIARRTGQPSDDLFQEGYIGLMESVDRFVPAKGKFATCALPWIRMRVGDAATTNQGALGLSARRARQWRRVRSTVSHLTGALARTPRVEEIARETGETPRVVRSLLAFSPVVPLGGDDPRWLQVRPTPAVDHDLVDTGAVRALLGRLDPFDRALVLQLYGLDGPARSHAELAEETGRSESTIRRRERRALALMRAGDATGFAA